MRIALAHVVLALVVLGLALGAASAQDAFEVARSGTVAEVAAALAAGADVGAVDEAGDTMLLVAVRHNGADVVAALLDAGADASFTNAKTGLGIFGLAWRNPDGAAIRALFAERGLVPVVGVRPGEASLGDGPQAGVEEAAAPRPAIDAPPLPERVGGGEAAWLAPEAAEELGYRYRPGAAEGREEVRDWVTSRFVLNGPLPAEAYAHGCRAAVLDLMRSPETVMFGDAAPVLLDDEGVIRYATYALSQTSAGDPRRWSLGCTGFVEDDVLFMWIEIEAR